MTQPFGARVSTWSTQSASSETQEVRRLASRGRNSMSGNRRPRLKELAASSAQERRRRDFLNRQKQARRNLSDHARLLATAPQEEDEEELECDSAGHASPPEQDEEHNAGDGDLDEGDMAVEEKMLNTGGEEGTATGTSIRGGVNGRKKRGRDRTSKGGRGKGVKRRDYWANQLCTPEWMLTVPPDLNGAGDPLGSGWYVMPRPEGKRVLLIAANGETVARQMSGAISHRFTSHLPGGSAAGRRGGAKGGGYCILDCVFHELDQTFFVLDMMAWKGYPLYDCTTDFRFYWIRTKLLEANGPLDTVGPENAYRIKHVQYQECDRQGLAHAYSSPVPFIKDGLLFHLKQAHYQLGPTPLVLRWKDAKVARYLGTEGPQAVVLKADEYRPTVAPELQETKQFESDTAVRADSEHRSRHCMEKEEEMDVAAEGEVPSGKREAGNGCAVLSLLTSDGVCLGEVGPEGSATYIPHAKAGQLLRFTLEGAEEEVVHQPMGDVAGAAGGGECSVLSRAKVMGLRFEKRCSKLRPMADTWSKVLFQSRQRRQQGILIDDIDARINPQEQPQPNRNDAHSAAQDDDDIL